MGAVDAHLTEAGAHLPKDVGLEFEGGTQLHVEPPGHVFLREQGEGGAVDLVLAEDLEIEGIVDLKKKSSLFMCYKSS